MTELARIRNFAIIAHIDHGKSTLADRIIERCGGLEAREMTSQVLELDGARARARHHHQGPDRAPALPGAGRRDLPVQSRRHAGPCRFRLRGQPQLARLRGLAAAGRRHPGRRGADARQRLSGDRRRPRDRAGAQQDRSAGGRARADPRAGRGHHRPRCQGRAPDLGQDRAGRRGRAGGDRPAAAAASGRRRTRRSRRSWSTAGTTPISAW